MKYLIIIFLFPILLNTLEKTSNEELVLRIAINNSLNPSPQVIFAIAHAAKKYNINATELAAIAIIESNMGKYTKTRINSNKTKDIGLFQINSINFNKCKEYNIYNFEGNAFCAAKILSQIKTHRSDYIGVYHSKTIKKKQRYLQKIAKVFKMNTDKKYIRQIAKEN